MNQYANPLDYILQCVEIGLVPYQFDINNAKDELKNIRKELQELEEYRSMQPVAWGMINNQRDLYCIRTQDNPHIPDEVCVPLYSNRVEFKDFYAKYRK
jgi:hypothetical protein